MLDSYHWYRAIKQVLSPLRIMNVEIVVIENSVGAEPGRTQTDNHGRY